MKIALLLATPGTTWGGMEKHVADLAEALAAMCHEVHVIAHPDYLKHFQGITFHPCPMNFGRKNPWLKWRIAKTLEQIAPDIAHAHGNKAASLLVKVKSRNWQTIGTVHGSKSSVRPFMKLDKVIAVSRSIFDQIDHPHRFLVCNGARKAASQPPSNRYSFPAAINIVAAGRLEKVKGFDLLIQAWPAIKATCRQAHLTIFGEGTDKEVLRMLIREKNVEGSVTLAGYQANLASTLLHADLLAISSRREGFPYVLIEALLAECPVVSTPVSGCTELLPEKALASDFSIAAIGETLTNALANLEGLRVSEHRAFALAAQQLTLEGMAGATVDAYKSEIAR